VPQSDKKTKSTKSGGAGKNPRNSKHVVKITIKPLHTKVTGRARYYISALHRQEHFAAQLNRQLLSIDGITSAQANVLTGNVMVTYRRDLTVDEVTQLLQKAVKRAATGIKYTKTAGAHTQWLRNADLGNAGRDVQALGDQLLAFAKQQLATIAGEAEQLISQAQSHKPHHGKADNSQAQPEQLWHSESAEQVLSAIGGGMKTGLSQQDADKRLQDYGLNELPNIARRSELSILMEQFMTVPVGLLAVSAVVSVATGGVVDAAVILAVVAINAGIGFVTERQAENTIASLTKATPRYAKVIRDGNVQEIPHAKVALGDLLLLNPGDFVAADARIVKAQRFTVDESALTGESVPVNKSSDFLAKDDTPLADRLNMVHMGTMVTGGNALAVVVATGIHTEIGKIQIMVGIARPPETPMQLQLEKIGTQLAIISSVVCASVFFIGLLRGQSILQMLKSSISLAVAAVPEGLPTVATTTLALGIRKMHQHKVAIRQLNAVETLGSVQVFCLDKTGTLTLNRMSVVNVQLGMQSVVISDTQFVINSKVVDPLRRKDFKQFLQVLALCNEIEDVSHGETDIFCGSPTENALLELAVKGGLDIKTLRKQLPRSKIEYRSENRPYMVTSHSRDDGKQLVAVKGSPQEVLQLCATYLKSGKRVALSDDARQSILNANERMAGDALRVLGVAFADHDTDHENVLENLTWLGLAGMIDPLRTGMPDLIHTFHQAGIKTVMITGDQSATAYAIGKQLNLSENKSLQILDSNRLDKLDPDLLQGVIENVHVFARVSPANKLQIVQALQKSGKAVAMTGDGINDGPALKAADIGVAMGGANTDIARSVSDVVLEDDNLHTMVTAVHEGRAIYSNIRKSIHYLVATNLSEIEVMLAGVSLGLGQPLSPMQLLWINLVSDIFPGLALSLEPPEPDLMQRPPRSHEEQILRRQDLSRMLRESAFITAGSFASYAYGYLRYGPGLKANTLLFNSLTLAQLIHAYSCRSDHYSIFSKQRLPCNPYLLAATGGSVGLQLLAMLVPGIRNLLGSTTIGLLDGLVIAAGAATPLVMNEFIKETSTRKLVKLQEQGDKLAETDTTDDMQSSSSGNAQAQTGEVLQ
jgi:Ca2+-transporting ATPase